MAVMAALAAFGKSSVPNWLTNCPSGIARIPNPLHLMMVLGGDDSMDQYGQGQLVNSLIVAARRSLQKLTPTLLKNTCIDDGKLISEVYETNRRGEKKMIQKIVCPFCSTLVAPQRRKGWERWDVTNFNRHLKKMHPW